MLNRWIEDGLLDVLGELGIGCIVFSPLAQGLLTDKYLDGVPEDSRVVRGGALDRSMLSEENVARVRGLDQLARERGQTLAQMAISWVLRDERVTSALMGASRWSQVEDALAALDNTDFSAEELEAIDRFAVDGAINIWARSSDAG
jgi:L-glyceraldehyde 3-phosphate reductase